MEYAATGNEPQAVPGKEKINNNIITSASNMNKECFTLASCFAQATRGQGSQINLSQVHGMHCTCTHLGLDIVEGIKEEEGVLEGL